MKALLYSKDGKKKDEVVLNPEIFGAPVNERLLELIRNGYSANLRRGTADTKVRKEVQGGGKKPWKQKGTGRARHGSTRSPIWKGGGTVFGPHPRSYFVAMPKTMRRAALISALSLRGGQKNIVLVEDLDLQTPKTKDFAEIMKMLPLDGKRALYVAKDMNENLERASRNLSGFIEVERATNLNAYHILQREKIIIEQDAVAVIENRINGNGAQVQVEKAPKKPKAEKKAPVKKAAAEKKTKTVAKKTSSKAKEGKKKS
jgi:large subunit ribosomal protein L4